MPRYSNWTLKWDTMKYNLDTIFRISGSTDNDNVVAGEFIRECLKEADDRLVRMEKLKDITVVLDEKTFNEARSDLAGIRHIAQAIDQAAVFHQNGTLSNAFANASTDTKKKLKAAEDIFFEMSKLYP